MGAHARATSGGQGMHECMMETPASRQGEHHACRPEKRIGIGGGRPPLICFFPRPPSPNAITGRASPTRGVVRRRPLSLPPTNAPSHAQLILASGGAGGTTERGMQRKTSPRRRVHDGSSRRPVKCVVAAFSRLQFRHGMALPWLKCRSIPSLFPSTPRWPCPDNDKATDE